MMKSGRSLRRVCNMDNYHRPGETSLEQTEGLDFYRQHLFYLVSQRIVAHSVGSSNRFHFEE